MSFIPSCVATVQCPGGICCLCVCKSARISTIAFDFPWSFTVLPKKVLHKAQSAIPALGDILAVPHPSPETQQPQGSSLLSSELGQRQLWHIPKHVPASFIFPSSGCEQTLSCHPAALLLQQPLWNHCHGPMWDAEASFWRRPKSVLRTCTSQKR